MTDEKTVETEVIEDEVVCTMDNPDPENSGLIKVEAKKDHKCATIYYDFGSDLEVMTEKFGAEVVFSQAKAQMKIKLQSGMRSYLSSGRDIAELVSKYVPGVALERIPTDMGVASETYFTSLSEDEQDAMIARLMDAKAGN